MNTRSVIISSSIITLAFGFLGFRTVSAATPTLTVTKTATQSATPSATPVLTGKAKQIEDLKERLATKVAQLRQTAKRAIYGTIKSKTISTATVETKTKDIKIELTDELKVYQQLKGKRTALTVDDVSKDDVVSVFGEYDSTLEVMKAKVVFIQAALPIRISGKVSAVNKTDYSFDVETAQGKTYTVDFETTTKATSWSDKTLGKSSFSKIAVGATVHVTGFAVPKKENRISASRIVDLGTLTSPTVNASSTPTASPTGSTTTNTPSPAAKTSPTPTKKP